MEDKVKLIIEIPKAPKNDHERWVLAHGTPLDDVKAEIEALQSERYYFGFDTCKKGVLEIIDKHISGEGGR